MIFYPSSLISFRYSNLNNRLFKKEQIAHLVDKSDGNFSLETYKNEEQDISKIIEGKLSVFIFIIIKNIHF